MTAEVEVAARRRLIAPFPELAQESASSASSVPAVGTLTMRGCTRAPTAIDDAAQALDGGEAVEVGEVVPDEDGRPSGERGLGEERAGWRAPW